MGLLDILFGKTNKASAKASNEHGKAKESHVDIDLDGTLATIKGLGFFVGIEWSPSKEWMVGCNSGDASATSGSYVLCNMNQKRVALTGRLKRPETIHVADNGVFTIEDWLRGNDLAGTFYVMAPNGEVLIKRTFAANLLSSAISRNGKYALCQTANSPNPDDSGRLVGFDIEARKELFSIYPSTGWAESYSFKEETGEFCVTEKDVGTFCYSRSGELLDRDGLIKARLGSKDFSGALFTVESLLKQAEPEFGPETLLKAVIKARANGADEDKGYKAKALKLQGACLELLGKDSEALAVYEEALGIDPKIGVKKKADSLRKKLGEKEKAQ